MEPYEGISENTDVVFVENNDGYVPLVDDPFSYLEESVSIIDDNRTENKYLRIQTPSPYKLADGDYMTQFYLGAVSVVGLFILFRMMQKSKA
jgi:hypothetical protein